MCGETVDVYCCWGFVRCLCLRLTLTCVDHGVQKSKIKKEKDLPSTIQQNERTWWHGFWVDRVESKKHNSFVTRLKNSASKANKKKIQFLHLPIIISIIIPSLSLSFQEEEEEKKERSDRERSFSTQDEAVALVFSTKNIPINSEKKKNCTGRSHGLQYCLMILPAQCVVVSVPSIA